MKQEIHLVPPMPRKKIRQWAREIARRLPGIVKLETVVTETHNGYRENCTKETYLEGTITVRGLTLRYVCEPRGENVKVSSIRVYSDQKGETTDSLVALVQQYTVEMNPPRADQYQDIPVNSS